MLCRAVGAGDSLLLLLGDSVESKGRISFPRLLFCVRVEVFFQDKAKMERCGSALLSLFSSFLGARGGCGCTMRREIRFSFLREKRPACISGEALIWLEMSVDKGSGVAGLAGSLAFSLAGRRTQTSRCAGARSASAPGSPAHHFTVPVPADVTAESSMQGGVVINIRLLAWLAGPGEVEVLVVVGVSL